MTIFPLAGKPAPKDILVDLGRLESEYFERRARSRRAGSTEADNV